MNSRNILVGLLIVILIGCESNEITSDKMSLMEINDPTCYKDQFEYEGGRLISFKRFFGERVSTNTRFKYRNNQLIQLESESENGQDYVVELEYNSQGQRVKERITFTHFKNLSLDPYKIVAISDFAYNQEGLLLRKSSTYSDSTYSFPTETEFEWSNGNLVKMNSAYSDYLGRHVTGSKYFVYDDKRNYSNQDLAFLYLTLGRQETVLSRNNLVKTTEVFFDQTIDRGSYTFSYNGNGYPIGYKYKVDNQEYSPIQMKYE
jgi:hypothetical protein